MRKFVIIGGIAILLSALGAAENTGEYAGETEIDVIASSHGDKINELAIQQGHAPNTELVSLLVDQATSHGKKVSERATRKGRNPQTGKEIKIPAKKSKLVVTDEEGASDSAQNLAGGEGEDSIAHPDFDLEEKQSPHKGRNPQTGKEIKIPAKAVYEGRVKELADQLVNLRSYDLEGENTPIIKLREKESGEEYFVHATGLIDDKKKDDRWGFELREGRKGMNAVDVRRTD